MNYKTEINEVCKITRKHINWTSKSRWSEEKKIIFLLLKIKLFFGVSTLEDNIISVLFGLKDIDRFFGPCPIIYF